MPVSSGRWRVLTLGVPALVMVAIAAAIITFVALDNDAAATGPSRVTTVHHEVPAHVVVQHVTRTAS